MEKFKVTLQCDSCGKEFQGEYGDDEDMSDAACDNSCPRCGLVLCPQCSKIHDCEQDKHDCFSQACSVIDSLEPLHE